MELQVVDHPEQARYEARADGEVAGFIQYHLRDGVIALLHTEIDPRFRGHGVAGRLVQSTLEAARERHLGVLPYCPFVRGWITEHPDYAALVPEARRPEFGLLFLIATPMSFAAARRFTGDIGDRRCLTWERSDMDYKLELVLIPVSDVDRAKKFYLEQAGFVLIVDTPIGPDQRVVQVVPPGSECAIGFGTGITSAAPGAAQGLHLVVSDILAARAELTGRGVAVSGVRHIENGTWADGPHPDRENYQSFADFTDPDGNIWILQEVDRSKAQHGSN